jgi:hypothetical protein
MKWLYIFWTLFVLISVNSFTQVKPENPGENNAIIIDLRKISIKKYTIYRLYHTFQTPISLACRWWLQNRFFVI